MATVKDICPLAPDDQLQIRGKLHLQHKRALQLIAYASTPAVAHIVDGAAQAASNAAYGRTENLDELTVLHIGVAHILHGIEWLISNIEDSDTYFARCAA